MQNLHKIIKPITNTDILTIFRTNNIIDKNRLCININNKEKAIFNYSIQIIDIDNDVLDVSTVTFEAIVIIIHPIFKKYVKI